MLICSTSRSVRRCRPVSPQILVESRSSSRHLFTRSAPQLETQTVSKDATRSGSTTNHPDHSPPQAHPLPPTGGPVPTGRHTASTTSTQRTRRRLSTRQTGTEQNKPLATQQLVPPGDTPRRLRSIDLRKHTPGGPTKGGGGRRGNRQLHSQRFVPTMSAWWNAQNAHTTDRTSSHKHLRELANKRNTAREANTRQRCKTPTQPATGRGGTTLGTPKKCSTQAQPRGAPLTLYQCGA